jgi:crotonobetainyl-CoA hydratase
VSDFEHIVVDRSGAVLTVTMNRPGVLNALHPPAHRELEAALDGYAAAPELRLAVITGAGDRAFCTGSDLKVMAETGADDMPRTGFAGLCERFDLDKPVIAAVNGLAMGGGLEICLAADLVIAVEHATFSFPEPKVGLAAMGGIHRLFRQIPAKKAMELVLTGKTVTAAEALEYGLVNEVVAGDDLQTAVGRWSGQILACGPLAIEATKQAALCGLDQPTLEAAFGKEYPAVRRMLESADAREGPQAFAEKRKPVWRGE